MTQPRGRDPKYDGPAHDGPAGEQGRDSSRVLVIGAGFIGGAVARHLVSEGRSVRVLSPTSPRDLDDIEWVAGDACTPVVLENALESIDAVVWCSGRLLPNSSLQDLAEIDDLSPLVTVLRRLSLQPETRLIFMSSGGTVYGSQASRPSVETQPLMPESPYAVIKVRAERWIESFCSDYNVDAVVLRGSNLYGPGQRTFRPQGIIAHALDCVVQQRPLTLFADESSTRDYLFIDDAVRVITACCEPRSMPSTMNVGSGQATSLGGLLDIVREIAGDLSVVRTPKRPTDVEHSELDIAVLRCFMPDFKPTDLRVGLAAAWQTWPGRVLSPSSD
jgi:UDP-glucose 4-epimerase